MRAIVLVALTGCAANFADSFEPDAGDVEAKLGAAHGVEGEHVEYEMKLSGLTVGRFQIAVGNRGVIDGRPAVIVRSHASLAGAGTLLGSVDWDLTTTVDIDSGFAIAEEQSITVESPWRDGHTDSKQTWTPADRHHNAHSIAGALRGWFTAIGAHDAVDVTLVDANVPVTIADAAREPIGAMPAVRYDGMLRGRYPFSVWVSDDTARVPLRLHAAAKVGSIERSGSAGPRSAAEGRGGVSIDVEMVDYGVPRDP